MIFNRTMAYISCRSIAYYSYLFIPLFITLVFLVYTLYLCFTVLFFIYGVSFFPVKYNYYSRHSYLSFIRH